MKKNIGEVFLLLVCNDDGVVVLNFDELKQILSENSQAVEWISATRNRRQMYSIKGSDGKLSFKVGKDEFLNKMFNQGKYAPAADTSTLNTCRAERKEVKKASNCRL